MNKYSEKNKKLIKSNLIIAVCTIIIAIIIILVIRYNIEGEKNLPFKLTNIRVISTACGNTLEDFQTIDIIQKNDFYFYIEKNLEYTKEDSISKITFENFNIENSPQKGSIAIYKPSPNSILYSYNDEYKIENNLSYIGSLNTNLASLEISNQGGLIGFSIALKNLGNYVTNNNEEITHNGTLLAKLNLTNEDISMKISFDMIIETTSNKKFKSTLAFDLPTGNVIEDGRSFLDKNNFDDVVFKRF